MTNIETAVVINDLHIPFEDDKAVKLVLKFIKKIKPDQIFLNGDVLDCFSLSKFPKPLYIQTAMYEEIAKVEDFLDKLRKVAPKAKIDYIFGNHENRFDKHLYDRSPEFYRLKGSSLEEQLQLEDRDIVAHNSHNRENFIRYGHLLIGHFNKVSKHSAYTAKALLDDYCMSLIQAHTHRGGIHFKTTYKDTMVAVENFCLCSVDPHWVKKPNWQLGLSVVHTDKETDQFHIIPIPIINYRILYGKQLIELE